MNNTLSTSRNSGSTRGEPFQLDRNGQTLTVEWSHYKGDAATCGTDTTEILGVYDKHNDELPYSPELYAAAEKALFATRS